MPGTRIAVAAALSLSAVGLLAGCGSDSAPDPNKSYLEEVGFGAVPFNSDATAIQTGHGMCDLIETGVQSGQTVPAAKAAAKAESNQLGHYSAYHNSTIMLAAVASYCPEYMSDN